jgi:hypothetical protein
MSVRVWRVARVVWDVIDPPLDSAISQGSIAFQTTLDAVRHHAQFVRAS